MEPYYALALLPLVFGAPAQADDVNKNAGICAAYQTTKKDGPAAKQAMATATNQNLANDHRVRWTEELKSTGTLTKNLTTAQEVVLRKAFNACSAIGLR